MTRHYLKRRGVKRSWFVSQYENYLDCTGGWRDDAQADIGIRPMSIIYDSDLFADGEDVAYHFANGKSMPDDIAGMLSQLPYGNPVMFDLEALPTGTYQSLTDEQRIERWDYLGDVVKSIRQQAAELGKDDREWYWYGPPMSPAETPITDSEAAHIALAELWRDNATKINDAVVGFTKQCYDRWDGPSELARWKDRVSKKYEWASIIGKPTYAILAPYYLSNHSDSLLQNEAISTSEMDEMYNHVNSVFDGVVVWQAPDGFAEPDNYDDYTVTRLHLLNRMGENW